MTIPTPDPGDSRERLFEQALLFRGMYEEKRAVLDRIKEYVGVWRHDKRMRIMGDILLREIERLEREEAERTRSGDRRRE